MDLEPLPFGYLDPYGLRFRVLGFRVDFTMLDVCEPYARFFGIVMRTTKSGLQTSRQAFKLSAVAGMRRALSICALSWVCFVVQDFCVLGY